MPANSTPIAVSWRMPGALRHPADGEGRGHRRDGRAEVERDAEHVRGHDAREPGVGDRVADERDPAQHDVRADDRAHDADQRGRDERADEDRRAERLEDEVHQRPRSWKWRSPGAASSWWCASSRTTVRPVELEEVAAVCGREHVRVEEDLRGPVGDDRPVDREHLLEPLRGGRQVVGRRDDRLAAVRLGLEEVHQELLGRRVDAGHRLVEEEQVRLRGERPGEEHAPSLAAREPPDLRPQVGRHADLRQRVADGAAVVGARPADRPEPREAAHHHHVLDRDREPPVDELGLGHVRDAACLAAGRRPEDLDPPRPRLQEPGHQLEQRALAGAVRARRPRAGCPAPPRA